MVKTQVPFRDAVMVAASFRVCFVSGPRYRRSGPGIACGHTSPRAAMIHVRLVPLEEEEPLMRHLIRSKSIPIPPVLG